ncbi:MAG: glycosyltransferase family 2 protein [Gammaproteobacteria bacterium]|nr:glycosyltransferase family 2 protein [Gammaproteobacteria bacterium]
MLSVIVITKNEASNLARCLASVAFATEVIVLDSGSTDETLAVAKHYTNRVYSAQWEGYGIQKQRALALATCPWVLNLDADESVDDSLQAEILRVMQAPDADAYRIPIRMCFYDKKLRFSSSPSRHVRLFKREGATYCSSIVHEKVQLPTHTRIAQLKTPIWHHSFHDVSHMLQKMDRYSSYSAKIQLAKQEKSSVLGACLSGGWMFMRCYFLQLGCFDGKIGLLLALYHGQMSFYRAIKQCYPDANLSALPEVVSNE